MEQFTKQKILVRSPIATGVIAAGLVPRPRRGLSPAT